MAQAIFGIISPDSGEIYYQGEKFKVHSPRHAMEQGIAYLPEDRKSQGLFPILSVSYNITVSILRQITNHLGIVNTRKEREIAEIYVKELSIRTPGLEAKVFSLSGGNQQKVVLANWLGVNPRILILDEPTRGIDVAAKAEVHQMIAQLVERGIVVIIISSELPEVLKLADRVIVMHEGKITGVFEGEDISSTNLVRAATGERVLPGKSD